MIVLFDIDGTLLRSRGVGLRAMQAALEEIHPPRHAEDRHDVEAIDTAGRLDPLIWAELLAQRGIEPTPEGHVAFRRAYGDRMRSMIEAERPVICLDGAAEAVEDVRRVEQRRRGERGVLAPMGRSRVGSRGER